MKSTSGTVIRTGTFIAFSSARWRRFTRISRLWIRSTLPTGTPSWSAWNCSRKSMTDAPPSTRRSRTPVPLAFAMASTTSRVW